MKLTLLNSRVVKDLCEACTRHLGQCYTAFSMCAEDASHEKALKFESRLDEILHGIASFVTAATSSLSTDNATATVAQLSSVVGGLQIAASFMGEKKACTPSSNDNG